MDWGAVLDNTLRGLIGEQFIFFGIAAIGLNIHFGYAGLLNFGQAVFMAAGAYGLAMMVATWGLNFWIGVFVGVVVFPTLLALVLGIPTLRLRADYLAIVTIAAAEIFRLIVRSPTFDKWTGSSDGLTGFANQFYAYSPFDPGERYFFDLFIGNQMWVVIVGWVVMALVAVLCWRLVVSPWWRVLKAVRDDEDAARSLGKNAYSYKMQALIIGGMFGAIGGMLRAIATQSAQPDNFITDVTFFVWVALILGGAGTVMGPIVGASLLYAVLNFSDIMLRQGVQNEKIPESIMTGVQVGQVRLMLVGLGLALLAAFRPQGSLGNNEEMALDDR